MEALLNILKATRLIRDIVELYNESWNVCLAQQCLAQGRSYSLDDISEKM